MTNQKIKVKSTQTVQQEEEYFDCVSPQEVFNEVKKRRSHRNGKQNYLRKWPGSYHQ